MPKSKLPDKNFKWTPELAYVVGLLATDGNLSKDGRHIIMRSSDIQLLKIFKKFLGLSNAISRTFHDQFAVKPCYKIQFGNVRLYRWLLKIGLSPNKTHTLGKLDVPKKYFPDFLRGHLDGDGSIWSYQDNWNTFKNPKYIYIRLWVRFISASEDHIKWLRESISKYLSINGHLWKREIGRINKQTTTMWEIKFGKKESIKLLSRIYRDPNIPSLKRKRKIAEKFI